MSAVETARAHQAASRSRAGTLAVVTAVLLAGSYLVAAASIIASAPWFKWNEIRLACVAGLLDGYSLYATREVGPILPWIYPPLAAVFYLPAVLFRDPIRVILAGSLTAMACTIAPAAWLHFARVERERFGVAPCWVAFSAFGLFTTTALAPRYSCYWSHVDAPTLGAAAVACGALMRWLDREPFAAHGSNAGRSARGKAALGAVGWLMTAAMSTALAVACKQTLLPMLVVLSAWIVFERGWRPAVLFGVTSVAGLLVLLAASGAWLGFEGLWLNAFEVPRRHPLSFRGMYWVENALFPAVTCFAVLAMAWKSRFLQRTAHDRRRLLLIAVGISLIPSAFLSRAKYGGDVNSFSLFLYFFGLAASLELKHVLAPFFVSLPSQSRMLRRAALLALGVLAADGLIVAYADARATFLGPRPSPVAQALAIAREHDNAVFFPFHPLVVLRTEGRLYHEPRAWEDWELAGIRPSLSRLLQDVPDDQRVVAVRDFETPPRYLGTLTPISPPFEPAYDLRYFARRPAPDTAPDAGQPRP